MSLSEAAEVSGRIFFQKHGGNRPNCIFIFLFVNFTIQTQHICAIRSILANLSMFGPLL